VRFLEKYFAKKPNPNYNHTLKGFYCLQEVYMNMKIKTGLLAVCCLLVMFCGCEKTKKSDIDAKVMDKITPPATPPTLPKPSGGLALSID
jgi:hypothetical protein